MMTKLWKVSRTDRIRYDEYDSMVVAADTELEARTYHPNDFVKASKVNGYWVWHPKDNINLHLKYDGSGSWGKIEDLKVEYLGTTDRDIQGVILSSFNAG